MEKIKPLTCIVCGNMFCSNVHSCDICTEDGPSTTVCSIPSSCDCDMEDIINKYKETVSQLTTLRQEQYYYKYKIEKLKQEIAYHKLINTRLKLEVNP